MDRANYNAKKPWLGFFRNPFSTTGDDDIHALKNEIADINAKGRPYTLDSDDNDRLDRAKARLHAAKNHQRLKNRHDEEEKAGPTPYGWTRKKHLDYCKKHGYPEKKPWYKRLNPFA